MVEWLAKHRRYVDIAITIWKAVILVTGFALPAWAAKASEWLSAWGPISWVACGFAGLSLTVLLMWLLSARRRYSLVTRMGELTLSQGETINPLEDTFRRRRIRLSDLAEPVSGTIKDKNFIDCDIVGPGEVIFYPDCHFQGNGGELVDAVVFGRNEAHVGHDVKNCSFRNCRFYRMTFLVPEPFYLPFMQHGWTGLNWLTDVPAQAQLRLPEEQTEN